ncbi:MAG: very short patch repair endonuclease [Oscillospiraceae bacterium]|nr:very short patch repair endonuclease [Oscillospiraceae bacterium]
MPRTPEVTHKIMSAVRSSGTKPEMLLRKTIWRRGLRYRVNYKMIAGKPDIVFTKAKIAVFCDGDYWHGHNWALRGLASLEEELAGYTEYWRAKILGNTRRDIENTRKLEADNWLVMRFWESDIKRDANNCADLIETNYRSRRKRV